MPVPKVNLRLALKNILFATDFSAASQMAFPYAAALARWYGAKVVIAHSVPPEPPLGVPMDPTPNDLNLEWQHADRQMTVFLEQNLLPETPRETVLERGEVWEVLSATIRDRNIDLVVLGTHGRAGIRKIVLGSVAEQIFRRASCPVLTVGPHAASQTAGFENWKCILFATDFSAGSLNALPYALSFAEENQACLVLLNLIPLMPMQEQERVRENARRRLELLVPIDAAQWCRPEFIVGFDFPAEGILRTAEERGADLIVMGVRATSTPRASAHMPWAIAHEVVCHAHCPVLTVRG